MDLVQIVNWRPRSQVIFHEVGRLIYDERGEFILRVFCLCSHHHSTYQGQKASEDALLRRSDISFKMSTAANVPTPTAHANFPVSA